MKMTEAQVNALERIEKEYDESRLAGRVAKVIGKDVKKTISKFCEQNEEFAEFVFISDKTICDVINEAAGKVKNNGAGSSDIEVYTNAVKAYFPTATINFTMSIDLSGGAKEYAEAHGITVSEGGQPETNKPKKIEMSFEDLFGGI